MKFFDRSGTLGKGRRNASGADNISKEDIDDPKRLSDIVRGIMRRLSVVEAASPPEATEFEVDCSRNGTITLNHGFGCPVRYSVVHWTRREGEYAPAGLGMYNYGVISRACAIGTWQTTAIGNTNGVRYTISRRRDIIGIRFGWVTPGSARSIRCVLWNDTTGAVLAEKTVSVNATGVYEAIFDTPYTADLTGTSIVVSYYDLAGTSQTTTTDGTWKGIVPVQIGDDMQLTAHGLVSAGNARPTVVHGGATSSLAEPIFGHERSGPELVVDSASDANKLVLKSYVRGKAVIRIEPSQYATGT